MCLNPIIHIDETTFQRLNSVNPFLKNYATYYDCGSEFWKLVNDLRLENKIDYYNCRKCVQCLAVKKLDWIKRCEIEKRNWNLVYFITLTFNDSYYNLHTKKRFLSVWIRNHLRKFLGKDEFKYFAVSEYGSNTNRFHYHLMLFTNYLFDDMEPLKKSKRSNVLYLSDWFSKNWKYGFHSINIADSIASFRYCVKYTTKNQSLKVYCSRGLGDYVDNFETIEPESVPKSLLINAYARVWNAQRRYKRHEINKEQLYDVIKFNERYNAYKRYLKGYYRSKLFNNGLLTAKTLTYNYSTKYLHTLNQKKEL